MAVCLIYTIRKTSLIGSRSIIGKMNLVDFLDSMRIAAIRLNHLMDHLLGKIALVAISKTKLVFAHITYCESINNN